MNKIKNINSLKNGPIIYVNNIEEAEKATKIGASAIYIKRNRILDIMLIYEIRKKINILLIVQIRPGHQVEADILQHIGIDILDESYNLSHLNNEFLDKKKYDVNFICYAENLIDSIKRIDEGATLIKTKPEHIVNLQAEILEFSKYKNINSMNKFSKENKLNVNIIKEISEINRLQIVHLCDTNVDNIFDILDLKKYSLDSFIIDSSFLNQSENIISKLFKIIKSDKSNISKVLEFYEIIQISKNDLIISN